MREVGTASPGASLGWYHWVSAEAAWRRRDLERFRQHLNLSNDVVDKAGFPFARALNRVGDAALLFSQGKRPEARAELAAVRAFGRSMGSAWLEHDCLLMENKD